MATEKSKTIAVRVPNEIADALAEDAATWRQSPGTYLRDLLTKRYAVSAAARKKDDAARNTRVAPSLLTDEDDD